MERMAKKSEEEAEKLLEAWIEENDLNLSEVDDTLIKEVRYKDEQGREVVEQRSEVIGKKRADYLFKQQMINGICRGRIALGEGYAEVLLKKPIVHTQNGSEKCEEFVRLEAELGNVKQVREHRKALFSGTIDELKLIGNFCDLPENALNKLSSHMDIENLSVVAIYLLFY